MATNPGTAGMRLGDVALWKVGQRYQFMRLVDADASTPGQPRELRCFGETINRTYALGIITNIARDDLVDAWIVESDDGSATRLATHRQAN